MQGRGGKVEGGCDWANLHAQYELLLLSLSSPQLERLSLACLCVTLGLK